MKLHATVLAGMVLVCAGSAMASEQSHHTTVADSVIDQQRHALAKATKDKGYGPQAPRDIDAMAGENPIKFSQAPGYSSMNLCNIHFHKNAEHKGGEFTRYAGNGDGKGYNSGYKFNGKLNKKQLRSATQPVCPSDHGSLNSGDTIEIHYVFSSAQIQPGATLNACFNDAIVNPQLRVEAQVFVLVNDDNALNFMELTSYQQSNGLYQAPNIPANTGKPVQYSGSTTGPGYNEKGSPYQVTWSVRPEVAKVNINTVAQWCKGNPFEEDHAHGVRNLVVNPELLSKISSH